MVDFNEQQNVALFLSELNLLDHVYSSKGKNIEIYQHSLLGKVLVINNEIQHIESWSFFYHENLVHIPASFIETIDKILILGGGSFFAAHEALKYGNATRVVMVDYDQNVINIVKKNYNHPEIILKDKRFTLLIDDAIDFLSKNTEKFDLIICDAFDLLLQPEEKNLFSLLASNLTNNGVCSDVVYRHVFEKKTMKNTIEVLRDKYSSTFSLVSIPEYPGILHLLTMWGTTDKLKQKIVKVQNKIQQSWIKHPKQNPCMFYDPRFMRYYLFLPPYLKRLLAD